MRDGVQLELAAFACCNKDVVKPKAISLICVAAVLAGLAAPQMVLARPAGDSSEPAPQAAMAAAPPDSALVALPGQGERASGAWRPSTFLPALSHLHTATLTQPDHAVHVLDARKDVPRHAGATLLTLSCLLIV